MVQACLLWMRMKNITQAVKIQYRRKETLRQEDFNISSNSVELAEEVDCIEDRALTLAFGIITTMLM